MSNLSVCFAGHRFPWQCQDVEEKLFEVLEDLIKKGYVNFYDGHMGAFDKKCLDALLKLKQKYSYIKITYVRTYYSLDKEKSKLPCFYDDEILPVCNVFYKQIITKRNEWIVDNSDVVVCHIKYTSSSGAYNLVKYAKKKNKIIINI